MKTKGYTLIEILGVVTLLGIILLVSIPMVIGTLKKQNEREYERFLGDIYMATEAYVQKNIDKYPELNSVNGKVHVYINELIESKLLKSTVYNPKKKEAIKNELDYTVAITQNEDMVYQYEFFEEKIIHCGYTINQTFTFNYTGNVQEFNTKCDGNYKLEVYGAQGGSHNIKGQGGKGGYSIGIKNFEKNNHLYVYVGGKPIDSASIGLANIGGYNGGGASTYRRDLIAQAGGGATHIATTSGLLSTLSSNKSSILIVAGGGGGGAYHDTIRNGMGGAGGGLIGLNGTYNSNYNCEGYGMGGTQSTGGSYYILPGHAYQNSVLIPPAGFGFGSPADATVGGTGGGGGLYGGRGTSCLGGGGGGSSYIDGVTSLNEITAKTIAGNASMPTYDGKSTMTGNIGNGYAKITYLG